MIHKESTTLKTVLMVDDVPPVLAWARRVFMRAGWRVITAESAEAALQEWEAFHAGGDQVDLLISDVAMPGMDGQALVQALRSRVPQLPVIVLSGLPADELTWQDAPGQTQFIRKPATAGTLIAAAHALVGLPPVASAG
jgi:two-component system cell cycle sensor histidine kinase/response regulator CckA